MQIKFSFFEMLPTYGRSIVFKKHTCKIEYNNFSSSNNINKKNILVLNLIIKI